MKNWSKEDETAIMDYINRRGIKAILKSATKDQLKKISNLGATE